MLPVLYLAYAFHPNDHLLVERVTQTLILVIEEHGDTHDVLKRLRVFVATLGVILRV